MDLKSTDPDDEIVEKQAEETETQPKRQWGPQIIGAMIGAFIAMILGGLATQLGWQIGQIRNLWMWGAVIGGFIGAADSLAEAGSRLTKSDNRLFNIFISFLGMLAILLFVLGISRLTGWVLKLFNL